MSMEPLQALVAELESALARDSRGGAAVAGLLEAYCGTQADWRDFALFREGCYARNLVHGSALFELLVLCWHPGQVSPIHDHQGQRCWMGVLEGEIRERHFHPPEGGPGPLVAGRTRVFPPGAVAYIEDDIALHDIGPVGGGAVTLHLYSRPIRACRIFDPRTGVETLRSLVYHSVDGVPQD
jgi:cysteine dioxygenase